MKNVHSLSINLDKPIFHKNINVFFSKYHDTHVGNTLLVDDTLYKNMFNEPFNAIFLQSFHNSNKDDNYLLWVILLYLKPFHRSKFGQSLW
jgi:hypothetical protein